MNKNLFLVTIIIATLLATLASCNKEAAQENVNHSGEEYFRAIFLMEGELAKDISTFDYAMTQKEQAFKENPTLEDRMVTINNAFVSSIKQVDASFFPDLKQAVHSKDATIMEAVLDRGNSLLELAYLQSSLAIAPAIEAKLQELDKDQYDFSKQTDIDAFLADASDLLPNGITASELGDETAEGRWVVGPVIVAVALAAAAAAVYYKIYFWKPSADTNVMDINDGEKFAKEKLVNEVLSLSTVH